MADDQRQHADTVRLKLVRPGAVLPLSVCPDCEFYERKASACCPSCGSRSDPVVVCVRVLDDGSPNA